MWLQKIDLFPSKFHDNRSSAAKRPKGWYYDGDNSVDAPQIRNRHEVTNNVNSTSRAGLLLGMVERSNIRLIIAHFVTNICVQQLFAIHAPPQYITYHLAYIHLIGINDRWIVSFIGRFNYRWMVPFNPSAFRQRSMDPSDFLMNTKLLLHFGRRTSSLRLMENKL